MLYQAALTPPGAGDFLLARSSSSRPLALTSPGQGRALPAQLRLCLERFFCTELAAVRIYVSERPLLFGTIAFACGSELHFAPGCYRPHTAQGQLLLVHELVHVLQQRAGHVPPPVHVSSQLVIDDALEAQAHRIAHSWQRGDRSSVEGAALAAARSGTAPRPVMQPWVEVGKQMQTSAVACFDKIMSSKLDGDEKKYLKSHLPKALLSLMKWIYTVPWVVYPKNPKELAEFSKERFGLLVDDLQRLAIIKSKLGPEDQQRFGIIEKTITTNLKITAHSTPVQADLKSIWDAIPKLFSEVSGPPDDLVFKHKAQARQYDTFEELGFALALFIKTRDARRLEKALAAKTLQSLYVGTALGLLLTEVRERLSAEAKKSEKTPLVTFAKSVMADGIEGEYASFYGGFEKADDWTRTKTIPQRIGLLHDLSTHLEKAKIIQSKSKEYKVSSLDGTTDTVNAAKRLGPTWGTTDLSAGPIKIANDNLMPMYARHSLTTACMLEMATLFDESGVYSEAVAWAIFAFWRLIYDKTATPYHTFHEVMDIAFHNFGVHYEPFTYPESPPDNLAKLLARPRSQVLEALMTPIKAKL